MFHSATLKLTGLYVAFLVLICLFFSVNYYQISTRELDAGLGRQMMFFQANPRFRDFFGDDYNQSRQNQLAEARQHIVVGLVNINLIIILLGGVGSYFLARRTLRPIQEAHDAQIRFTADASHELRTPLSAMRTEIEVVLRDPKFDKKEATALLRSNLEELDKLTVLSDGLLKLARNGERLEIVKHDLDVVANQALERVAVVATNKKIMVDNQAPNLVVSGDEPSLVQLLVILLDNAIKYSNSETRVTLNAREESGKVIISVKDQGPGIKATDLSHIFDRFYRADTSRSKEKIPGYGLGLSIAKKIVESHHGEITAESVLGQGSVFTIKLPA